MPGLVRELGYDYIELSVTKTLGLDPEAYAAGKKALTESGLQAECFNILFPKTMNLVDGSHHPRGADRLSGKGHGHDCRPER